MINKIALTTILLLAFTVSGIAQKNIGDDFNQKKGVAIEGYDPVSYFQGQPKEGKENHSSVYEGVKYLFSSEENLNKFKAAPKSYIPEYGGWCAYAMGKSGDKVKIDPETYKIHNGKLYLFYNFRNQNTLIPWNENEVELKEKADQFWSKIIE